jgi:hypothetical protein
VSYVGPGILCERTLMSERVKVKVAVVTELTFSMWVDDPMDDNAILDNIVKRNDPRIAASRKFWIERVEKMEA